MTRPQLALALFATLAGCKIGGGEEHFGAAASCVDVGAACTGDAACCSYGCVSGVCAPNPMEGGACRTTNDCTGVRLCKSGGCATPTGVASACRDTADVCSTYAQCCSGNCGGGRCTVNRAPVADAGPDALDAPYTKPFTLANASADPDGDPLIYGWSFLSKPAASQATLSSATARSPTFTPDVVGTYVLRLVVTDGPTGAPNRLTAEDAVTVVAVNRSPVPVVAVPAAAWSRNVAITLPASASDPDGDALECAWLVTPPGATPALEAAVFATCTNPSTASHSFTPGLEGTYEVHYLARDRARVGGAVVNTAVASATFVSVNDAPVATVPSLRAGNVGPDGAPGAPVPVTATATDANQDAPLTWAWSFDQVAPGSALANADLLGGDTASVSFAPDAVGVGAAERFVLRVRVCDAGAACSERTVPVDVHRHVKPIEGPIADAEWANGKLFAVGSDPAVPGAGKLWIYSGGTLEKSVSLATVPTQVGVDRTGKLVVAADNVNVRWLDATLATPVVQTIAGPYPVGDVAVTSTQYAVLFPTTVTSGNYVHILDASSGAPTHAQTRHGRFGTASPTTDGRLFVNDSYAAALVEYTVSKGTGSGAAPTLGWPVRTNTSYSCTGRLWASSSNDHLFDGCGAAYTTAALAASVPLAGAGAPRHVHSTSAGAPVVLPSLGTTLLRYDASFVPIAGGNEALPVWGDAGVPHQAIGNFAFTSADGTTRWVIVEANGRTGLVTFP